MLRKSITFIFVLMAMTLFLTPAWGSTPDATDVEDQALTFFRNHEVAGTCVWVEFLENQCVLARGGGSVGGSGVGSGGGYGGGSHGKGSPGRNAEQQNQHQYQHQQKNEKQNQHQHQYQHQQKTEKQNQPQHQHQYQHREESGAQN